MTHADDFTAAGTSAAAAEPLSTGRRALLAAGLTGAAAAAASLVSKTSAEAAPGSPLILGAANDAGSAPTSLTTTTNRVGFTVLQSNAAGGAGGLFRSATGNGVAASTANPSRAGLSAANFADAPGAGAAVAATGTGVAGVRANTNEADTYGIVGINLGAAPPLGAAGAGIFADGGTVDGLQAFTVNPAAMGAVALNEATTDAGGAGLFADGPTGVIASGNAVGVDAESNPANPAGIAVIATGTNIGLRASVVDPAAPGALAILAQGNVTVNGTLAKSAGTFKIDHPLDPTGKWLYHSFVESPDMKNVYDGVVTLDASGAATVALPAYFEALNRDERYQLTPLGAPAPDLHVSRTVSAGTFDIAGGKPGMRVSWQVTGIRQDAYAKANPVVVEVAKTGAEAGRYLHPAAFGQPAGKGIAAAAVKPGASRARAGALRASLAKRRARVRALYS